MNNFNPKSNKMTDTGFKIKQLRELHKLSQEELALFLGVSQSTLSNIENGISNSLNFELVNKLCEKFDVGFDYFLNSTQSNSISENIGVANVTGNNYGTINNSSNDSVVEQVKQLVEDLKSKNKRIAKLEEELKAYKKRP